MPRSRHLKKRSLVLAGHRTSIAMEDEFLRVLDSIARERGSSFAALVTQIDASRGRDVPLVSALRLAALRHAVGEN